MTDQTMAAVFVAVCMIVFSSLLVVAFRMFKSLENDENEKKSTLHYLIFGDRVCWTCSSHKNMIANGIKRKGSKPKKHDCRSRSLEELTQD